MRPWVNDRKPPWSENAWRSVGGVVLREDVWGFRVHFGVLQHRSGEVLVAFPRRFIGRDRSGKVMKTSAVQMDGHEEEEALCDWLKRVWEKALVETNGRMVLRADENLRDEEFVRVEGDGNPVWYGERGRERGRWDRALGLSAGDRAGVEAAGRGK